MTNQKNDLRKFCERHSVRVLDTSKRAHRMTKINYAMFQHSNDLNIIESMRPELVHDTEPLYTIEIAESELERIAQFEKQVFNNLQEHGHYNLFETLMKQKEEERELINTYPAVKKAYEQYSLMLNLAKNHKI